MVKIGQRCTVRGVACQVIAVRPAGTVDVEAIDGSRYWRVSGLPFAAAKPERIALVCQECGKTWRVSPQAADPRCPKCGSVDWEVQS